MKYALYARVSTREQTTENQLLRLVDYAQSQKLEYDIFEETESTRKTRPVKQELLQHLRDGKYAGVIIYKLDRWARSSTELIMDVSELVKKGIGFLSLSDSLDFNTATGKLHFQILSAFGEFERELIRERTIEGLRRAKSQGKSLGRPKGSKDSKKRKLSGYILREAYKNQRADKEKGLNKSVSEYMN